MQNLKDPENNKYVSLPPPMNYIPISQFTQSGNSMQSQSHPAPPLYTQQMPNEQYIFSVPQYQNPNMMCEPVPSIQYIYPNVNSPRKQVATVPPVVSHLNNYATEYPLCTTFQPCQYISCDVMQQQQQYPTNNSKGLSEFATTVLGDNLEKEDLKFMQIKLEKLENEITNLLAKKAKKCCF